MIKRRWLLKWLLFIVTVSLVFGLMPGIAGAVTPPPNWDISGDWMLDFAGGNDNREFRDIVQDVDGNVSGQFWWLNGAVWEYGGTLDGYVSGNDLYLFYERPAPLVYTGEFNGTITKDGISGTFGASSGFTGTWSTTGNSRLLWEARVTGGGQILADSSMTDKKGNYINFKISFGGGAYIVNGEYWLDGLEVTFHNVSVEDIVKGKFVATSLTEMNFYEDGTIANYTVLGTFNDESGYKMIVRLQDSGEPGFEDNIRFELWEGSSKVYDSRLSGDFPGDSSATGTNRTSLDRGNIQVEDLR